MPLSSLLTSRSKTDHVKHLKELFTVIENEQDKEKKNYEEVKNLHLLFYIYISLFFYLGNKEYT
jgi:hypothetical protein